MAQFICTRPEHCREASSSVAPRARITATANADYADYADYADLLPGRDRGITPRAGILCSTGAGKLMRPEAGYNETEPKLLRQASRTQRSTA